MKHESVIIEYITYALMFLGMNMLSFWLVSCCKNNVREIETRTYDPTLVKMILGSEIRTTLWVVDIMKMLSFWLVIVVNIK